MNSERLRQLVDTQGPFASIYFEDSHDTQDAAAQLDVKWHDIRKELEDQGADAALVSGLERAILDLRPPVGRSGRGVVAGAHGVLLNEHLIRSPASTVVRVSELPYVVPLIELGAEHAAYMVVAVDHVGADVALHRAGAVRSETVDAGAYPVHKTPAAGLRGYGDPQHRVDEAVRKNVRAVADRLTELEDESRAEVVFVVGQDRSRAELISYLPERVASRVVELHVGVRHTGIDDDVRRAIDAEFERRRLTMFGAAAERFRGEKLRESGLAVEGLARVCAALREGAVETLIIGDVRDETVLASDDLMTIALNPDVLSEQGVAPTRTLRADEALPFAAISVGASLVRANGSLEPADGIAALLRYPPTTWG